MYNTDNTEIITEIIYLPKYMKKFLVIYLAPVSVMEEWKKSDPEKMKSEEEQMMDKWKKWTGDHAKIFVDMDAGVGKTKRITAGGTSDTKNEIMLYAIVEAESHEEAAKIFESHPHLSIPETSIEIMEIHPLPGMKDM
jgi:hypothetical protein